jgi:hypothetical protein
VSSFSAFSVTRAQVHWLAYCPQTTTRSLIEMRHIRMRKISWLMTSCYYQPCKQSHSTLVHYTPLEMLDVFSVCSSITVAFTNSSPLVSSIANSSPPPRTAPDITPPTVSSLGLWSVHIWRYDNETNFLLLFFLPLPLLLKHYRLL